MRLNQETKVAVLTKVRGEEHFRRLAAHLSANTHKNKTFKKEIEVISFFPGNSIQKRKSIV